MTMKRRPYKRVKPASVAIKMVDGDIIEGTVNIGFEQRVSDLFANEDKTFMPVFDANGVPGPVFFFKVRKSMSRNKLEQLMKNCVTVSHGLNLLSCWCVTE